MMRLTGSGKLLLGICAVLYVASLTSQSGLLLLPIGLVLGCFAVNFVSARSCVAKLELEAPAHASTSEGRRLEQPWCVRNASSRPAGFVMAESAAGSLFKLAAVAARGSATVLPDLLLPRRGVYPHAEVRLGSAFPFGLLQVLRRVRLPGEIIVHPALYPTDAPRATGMDPVVGGKHSGNRQVVSGGDFAGTRPMRLGDPFRHIHWKASTKGQGLMVKTFQEELAGRIGFIVDCGQTGDPKALDDCLRAAGSLMFAALDAGHHLEWVDLEHTQAELFPPFTDGQEILDRLARVELQPNCLDQARLEKAVALLSRKTALCFVVTTVNDALRRIVDQCLQEHRVVTLYLPAALASTALNLACPVYFYTEREVLNPA